MFSPSLDTEQRDEALACLAKDQFDILVIGGGVTGVGAGPGMFDISAFLGKEEVMTRLELGLTAIQKMRDEASH